MVVVFCELVACSASWLRMSATRDSPILAHHDFLLKVVLAVVLLAFVSKCTVNWGVTHTRLNSGLFVCLLVLVLVLVVGMGRRGM